MWIVGNVRATAGHGQDCFMHRERPQQAPSRARWADRRQLDGRLRGWCRRVRILSLRLRLAPCGPCRSSGMSTLWLCTTGSALRIASDRGQPGIRCARCAARHKLLRRIRVVSAGANPLAAPPSRPMRSMSLVGQVLTTTMHGYSTCNHNYSDVTWRERAEYCDRAVGAAARAGFMLVGVDLPEEHGSLGSARYLAMY